MKAERSSFFVRFPLRAIAVWLFFSLLTSIGVALDFELEPQSEGQVRIFRQRIQSAVQRGRVPVVVFDLDDTLS